MRSVKDLKNILGDYLFNTIKASNQRKEKEKIGISVYTSAINISFPSVKDSSNNNRLKVILNFKIGHYVYTEVYPS
jgi:hypothetical protein